MPLAYNVSHLSFKIVKHSFYRRSNVNREYLSVFPILLRNTFHVETYIFDRGQIVTQIFDTLSIFVNVCNIILVVVVQRYFITFRYKQRQQ